MGESKTILYMKEKFMSFYVGTPYEKGASECFDLVKQALIKQGIYADLILWGALATIRVETGKDFLPKRENLNYSPKQLLTIFPKYFTQNNVKYYAYQPELIANKVYAYRLGNGGVKTGDGYYYRGANYLQITGKSNHLKYGFTEKNCLDPKKGAESVAKYFKDKKIYIHCERKDWVNVRKAVNGGNGIDKLDGGTTNGLKEFVKIIKQYLSTK